MPLIKKENDFEITEITEFDDHYNVFWDQIKNDYNFILEITPEYLNWRFKDTERGTHTKFEAKSGEKVLGYVVVGYKHGRSDGQIIDLLTLKDRMDVADELFRKGCEHLEKLGINSIYYQVVMNHPYHILSKRFGFIDTRSRPNIALQPKEYQGKTSDISFLENTDPSQVYFCYSSTI
jgi:hypothetical protein